MSMYRVPHPYKGNHRQGRKTDRFFAEREGQDFLNTLGVALLMRSMV